MMVLTRRRRVMVALREDLVGYATQIDRDRMSLSREDTDLILDAMSYVDAVHMDLTAENTAPAPGVAGRVVAAILADPSLSDYVQTWASQRRALEARVAPPARPPIDSNYERVRELLRRAGDRLPHHPTSSPH